MTDGTVAQIDELCRATRDGEMAGCDIFQKMPRFPEKRSARMDLNVIKRRSDAVRIRSSDFTEQKSCQLLPKRVKQKASKQNNPLYKQ